MLRIFLFVFLVFVFFFATTNGQDCIPKSVRDVSLSFLGRLSWAVPEDETCEVTHYMVHISEPDLDARFRIKSFTTTVNVDYLMACEKWHFNIIPYVNETEGFSHLFISKIPVPMDADLGIGYINITRPEEEGDLHLEWDLRNAFFGDCSLKYRVTMSEDDGDMIHDLYMDDKYINLHFLSPCVNYEFGVRAINSAPPTMEGPLSTIEYDYPAIVQNAPILQSVNVGATTVNLTYTLEPAARNRCPIREFYVNGGAYFNVSLALHDSDEREPVEVQLTALKPNSMYLLRASVQNSAGWSIPSVIAVQTLDLQPDVIN